MNTTSDTTVAPAGAVQPLPECFSIWRHTSGREYEVIMVSNTASTEPERYPVTVIYADYSEDSDNIWSRPLSDWRRSMTQLTDKELAAQ